MAFYKTMIKQKFNQFIAVTPGILGLLSLSHTLKAQTLNRLCLQESTDLSAWQSISVTPEMIDDNGKLVLPGVSSGKFYRLEVEVIRPPSMSAQPASAIVTSGNSTTLSVTASGTGPFTYQWYQGAVGITTNPVGTNSATFTTPELTATTTYWARVTNLAGSVDSLLVTVTVATAPNITNQPVSTMIDAGNIATLTVEASGTTPLNYQWFQGEPGTVTNPVGTNSPNLTTPALTSTTTYWVRVTNAAGVANSKLASVDVRGSTPIGMGLISAGPFTMGETLDGERTVNLSAYYMGKYEVTKAEWDDVRSWALSNGYTDLVLGGGKARNHPVQAISWCDMVKWCNARSEMEGLTPVYTVNGINGEVIKTGNVTYPTVNWSANGYRLPTEAEWEKAARGGVSGKRFSWGTDTISHSQANYRSSNTYSYDISGSVNSYHPSYNDGAEPYTSPVGSFAANGYGLHDMAGNVWEWCWDWAGSPTFEITDPRGPDYGSTRVFRGGSCFDFAFTCRVTSRNSSFYPWSLLNNVGFRVARSFTP